jgi:hypothetical protein
MNEGGGEGLFYWVLLFLALATGLGILAIGVVKKRKSATIIGGALVAIPAAVIAVVLLVNGAVLVVNATADKPPTTTVTAPASSKAGPSSTTTTTQLTPSSVSTSPSTLASTITTRMVPAATKDSFLGMLRLDVMPREGVRVAVGGLREVASGDVGPRQRLIEGEIIIANKSSTPFAYRPEDFRLSVGPFMSQIQGVTVSTEFLVRDAVLTPVKVGTHPFIASGEVAPGVTLHGYLLTFLADKGTGSSALEFNSSDSESAGKSFGTRAQP